MPPPPGCDKPKKPGLDRVKRILSRFLRMPGLAEIFKSVFRPGTKPISEVLHGEVSKVDFILKNLSVLHIGDQKSFCLDHILFRRWVLVLFYCSFA